MVGGISSSIPSASSIVLFSYCRLLQYVSQHARQPHTSCSSGYLDARTEKKPSTAKTLELLDITQRSNIFGFGEKLFKQVGGTSIGKKHAPALCCLGPGKLEEDIIFPAELFRGLVIKDKGSADESERFFKRFIDDMMALTNGTADDAKEFVGWLNTLWPGLQFTYEWSNQEITFFDVRLVIEN